MAATLGFDIDGTVDAPVLVLGSSLGTTAAMWAPQVEPLSRHFRLVRFDHRGHGRSDVPSGPYTLDDLGGDVLALLDRLGLERASYAGVSLGGMVGMWLAAHAADRVDRLAVVCSAAYLPPRSRWADLEAAVTAGGMGAVADAVVGRWFTPGFAATRSDAVGAARDVLLATPPRGYAGCAAAIGDMDLRGDLHRITAPTLVVAAREDPSIPAEHGRAIADAVPGATYVEVDGAHLACIENADGVTAALLAHLVT
jgi:3-oxoadipate enol-lactonase